MKSSLLLSAALLLLNISFAANNAVIKPTIKASEILVPVGSSGKTISLLDLSRISIKDAQALTGKKMGFMDRMSFKAAQLQLRRSINNDGTIDSKRMANMLAPKESGKDVTAGFHLGGFLLGFFLSLIGVLIAYLINDSLKPTRVKWAWIGAAVSLVIWLVIGIL